eukprot:Nk52_evm24s236 gene=Nk52_evmTU24s236
MGVLEESGQESQGHVDSDPPAGVSKVHFGEDPGCSFIINEDEVHFFKSLISARGNPDCAYASKNQAYKVLFVPKDTWHPLRNFVGDASFYFVEGHKNPESVEVADIKSGARRELPFITSGSMSSSAGHQTLFGGSFFCEVGAHPLFTVADSITEEHTFPVDFCRKVLSSYFAFINLGKANSAFLNGYPSSHIPIVVATDYDTIPFMGMAPEKKSLMKGMWYRPFSILTEDSLCVSGGPSSVLSPSLSSIVDRFTQTNGDKPPHIVKCSSLYHVLGNEPILFGGDIRSSSNVYARFSWNNPDRILAKPSLSAGCTIFLECLHGNEKSLAYDFFKSLKFLRVLADVQQSRGKHLSFGEGPLISNSAEEFINCIKAGGIIHNLENPSHHTEEGVDDVATTQLQPRLDLDFTELLWRRIENAQNVEDIIKFVQIVFTDLFEGKLQPLVHKNNRTTAADLIRETLKAHKLRASTDYRSNIEQLKSAFDHWKSEENAIELAVEIGISKLARDFCHTFVGEELVTMSQLEYFFENFVSFDEQIDRLFKLYNVFEIFATFKSIAGMPVESLRTLLASAIQHFTSDKGSSKIIPLCAVPLPSFTPSKASIVNLCHGMYPIEWTLSCCANQNKNVSLYRLTLAQETAEAIDSKLESQQALDDCVEYKVQYTATD